MLKKGAIPTQNLPMPSFFKYPRNPSSKFEATEIKRQAQTREIRREKRAGRTQCKINKF